ncbi:MAG: hypothetical protein AB7F66_09310 [Bacteriovoracia bacterium]
MKTLKPLLFIAALLTVVAPQGFTWAATAQGDGCSKTDKELWDQFLTDFDGTNSVGFDNFTDHGVCWGMAKFQLLASTLARFDPNSPVPTDPKEVKKLVHDMTLGQYVYNGYISSQVTTFPGVSNVEELTNSPVYGPVIHDVIEAMWQGAFINPRNLGQVGVNSPSGNLSVIEEMEGYLSQGIKPLLQLQFSVGNQHIVIATEVKRNPDGSIIVVTKDNNYNTSGNPPNSTKSEFKYDSTGKPIYDGDPSDPNNINGNSSYCSSKSKCGLRNPSLSDTFYRTITKALRKECAEKEREAKEQKKNAAPATAQN